MGLATPHEAQEVPSYHMEQNMVALCPLGWLAISGGLAVFQYLFLNYTH